jgi:aspartate racemase
MKTLGILGGIGPEASSYFYAEIIRRLRESGTIHKNVDYPQIFINSINAPELVSLEVTDEMLDPYVRGVTELASLMPDFIVMACNTIHLFRDRLIKQSGYKNISDLSQIVSVALAKTTGPISVIGTPTTVSSGLYRIAGRIHIDPSPEELQEIGDVVVNYNATGEIPKNKSILMHIIESRRVAGAEIFIAGCTEISELLRGIQDILLVDTLELLIEDTLRLIQSATK